MTITVTLEQYLLLLVAMKHTICMFGKLSATS